MADTIVVVAAGEMGAGIGRRLSERGARVLTSLKGRGPGSAARAKAAGMTPVEDDGELVAQADVVLSVVPPGHAVAFAERMKTALARATKNPLFVDCNAVAPQTAERIGGVLAGAKCRYVDGGIVGPPPGPGTSPRLYVSGPAARDAMVLANYGLTVRLVDGDIGAASAMKLSYAGINKGLQAIAAAMILGATRAGTADALKRELTESQPHVLKSLTQQLPRMFPKAYRWVAEMEEISTFLQDDAGGREIYAGMAKLYARLAAGHDKSDAAAEREIAALAAFCADETAATRGKRAEI